MNLNELTNDERLIAERAVAMARAVKLAGDEASYGHGLACMEQAVLDEGRELLRMTLERSISARPEAQKKGARVRRAHAEPGSGIGGSESVNC